MGESSLQILKGRKRCQQLRFDENLLQGKTSVCFTCVKKKDGWRNKDVTNVTTIHECTLLYEKLSLENGQIEMKQCSENKQQCILMT